MGLAAPEELDAIFALPVDVLALGEWASVSGKERPHS